ncbi:phage tail spike protein [Clostridium perfringens]|uniref:phage tail spike protein n=1 Tax=Clostridium perfringens TaxID=1502 RepID=UPI0021488FF3|nr:phage tail spike protein [Clostridium perfringens]MDH5073658.1 Murein DD-endopeptidase MepM [Clostridium perfringens]MDK0623520.1 phage tail spike protein [Clostridium perfringens]MDK0759305.1 phage tail spike protein [Clostridium perfringens]MDM0854666.1 phage tail spike protein [Clostridium perfringens]UUR85230.1 peptidoglycan DD-metalloendopeptidase family protein [Clostridium perfringens]
MQYYKIDNYNFTKNGDITLQPIDGKLRVELNTGLCEVEVELPYDKEKRWTKLEEWGVIKTDVFYSKNKQLFRIYNTDKGMFSLKIKARHIFFDLVKHNLLDTRAVECTGQQALDKILEGTKYKGHSDIGRITTSYFQVTNIVQALNGENDNTFRNRWGGEMLFDNFDIYINNRIGGDYGLRVNYSRNMEDVNLIIDRDNIVTRAYPRAFDGIMLPEKYIDSPLINKYPIVCEDYIDMSDLKLKDSNTSNDEGFDTEEELYQAMRKRVKALYETGIDKPKVSGNVKVAMLENSIEYKDFKGLVNIGIGDTVTVNHKDIGIDMKTRAITIEWNLVTKKYENVEFGDVEVNYFAKQDIAREQLDNILNKNGTVNAGEMEGIINAMQTKFKALRDVAQPQHQLGMLFEDKIKGSKTYGAMAIGSMGFMIASERTLDDKDWNWKTFGSGQGFFADWLVGKLRTVLITNMDNSFEMDLNKPGGMIFKNNSIKAMLIENNALKMFNWKKDGQYIGGLTSLIAGDNKEKPLVGLTNSPKAAINIGYEKKEDTKVVPSYLQFDKYNILGDENAIPIRIWEDIDCKGRKLYNVDISSINKKHTLKVGEDFINIGNEKCEIVVSDRGVRIGKQNTFFYDANTGEITINAPIKNSNGQVILDPNNFGIGGGGLDNLGNVSKGIPSKKYFRYVKGIEGLQQYPGNIGDGEITYGYGVTKSNEPTYFAKLGAAPCSEETASKVLFELIPDKYGSLVKNQMLKDGVDLNKVPIHIFDAFVDLTYNSGRYNSSLYRDWVNGVSPKIIYNKWLSYITMPGSIFEDGLKRRRKEEAEMFLNSNYMMSSIGILNAHGGQIGTVKGDGYFPSIASNFKSVSNDYGNWILPVTGSVTALFGKYPSGAKHTGTDIGCPEGTPVHAARDGVVIKRRELTTSYGKYLMIDHGGGLVTIYGHNSKLLVNEADHIKQGQVIALSGSTGNSTGNHCHIELRYNGTPVNFAPSLRIGQVV